MPVGPGRGSRSERSREEEKGEQERRYPVTARKDHAGAPSGGQCRLATLAAELRPLAEEISKTLDWLVKSWPANASFLASPISRNSAATKGGTAMQIGVYPVSAHPSGSGTPAPSEGMVLVPAGSYEMGSLVGGEFEQPVHRVEMDAFWMDATPVTNQAFARFVEATGHRTTAEQAGAAWGFRNGGYQMIAGLSWRSYALPERQEHPVVLVSWHDAAAFASWCGKALPTEAQWEKAARGALENPQYPWGDSAPDGSQCNFAQAPGDLPGTREVSAFEPNGYGLFDMVGNVWQWCRDWYAPDYYAASPKENPEGPSEGETKVRRGGAWNVLQPFRLRVANRGALPPQIVAPNLGFRCVLPVPQQPDATWREVENVLTTLRPAMEADGGGVDVKAIEGGTVLVALRGSCLHCPSQSLTLKRGLEQGLKAALPWVENVKLA